MTQARGSGAINELALAVVLEEVIAVAHRGDEEIRVPVVVRIGEGSGHADLVAQVEGRLLKFLKLLK